METEKITVNGARSRKLSSRKPKSLLSVIFAEVFIKNWFLMLLILVAVFSSMQKAKKSHNERRAVAKLQLLKDENQQLQVEWQFLNIEMSALSESNRVTQIVKDELGMVTVDSSNEKIISL